VPTEASYTDRSKVLSEKLKEIGTTDPQVMVFRIDAHNLLKQHAESMPNITMHLGNGLVSVDTANASIKLASGEERSGDLVVGADGIHSLTLQSVDASAAPTSRMGLNMYRFLVPAAKAKQNTEVSAMLDQIGFFDGVGNNIINATTKNSCVIYPCRGCELVNVLTFQAEGDEKTKLPEDDYNCPGTPEDVQHLLRKWPQKFQALAGMAEDVKHWAAVTRDVPSTYVKDRLVLVGDAAHPTMPKLGAGAGMGMEDAGTLATLLDGNVTKGDLPKRLELYNQLRYPRTVTCKFASEIFKLGWTTNPDEAAQELLTQKVPGAHLPKDPPAYLFKYDVVQEAKNALAAAA